MPVITNNTASRAMPLNGSALQTGNYSVGPYGSQYYGGYFTQATLAHKVTSVGTLQQVVGLVPVFPCTSIECRLGKYGSDDSQFMLPVFAENQITRSEDYKNDFNSWLFDVPAASGLINLTYYLDSFINGAWVQQDTLIDDTYGKFFPIGSLCNNNDYTGYRIQWNKVLNIFGEGIYRFRIGSAIGSITNSLNHFKLLSLFANTQTIELITVGYGLICPTFNCNILLSMAQNMINLVSFINTYQAATYPTPLFHAVYNTGTAEIDIKGLQGQNCICSALVTNCTYSDYSLRFMGGINTYENLACYASPPFCLKTWDCWGVNNTSRFDSIINGGIIGNVDKSQSGGTWSFCCTNYKVIPNIPKSSMFAIRFANIISYQGTTSFTITFSPTMNILLAPFTVNAGDSGATTDQNLANAINAYQATLPSPLYTALYNLTASGGKRTEIYCLSGLNISFIVTYSVKKTIVIGMQGYMNSYHADNTSADLGTLELPEFSAPKTSFRDTILLSGGTPAGFTTTGSLTPFPFTWKDSIRIGGEFGYENTDYERKSIKYQTGVVNKIRDEAILKHTWKSSSLPFWFHERFKVYGLMADTLLVSDYNMNNSDYNIKLYSVQGDSSYNPDYKNHPRETMVKCEFKPAVQNLKRNRCC